MGNDLEHTYNLSFTAGTLMMNETCAVAEAFLESGHDWESTKERTFKENLMEKEKVSTIKRVFMLVKQRLEALNDDELEQLVHGTAAVRRLILILAICKAHSLVYDFISQNVRECFFNQSEKVTHANFNEFFNEKRYVHSELEAITDNTVAKIRQTIFKMLEQSELIDSVKTGILHRPYLPENLEEIIVKDNPKWLAIYLYSNNEINNARDLYE